MKQILLRTGVFFFFLFISGNIYSQYWDWDQSEYTLMDTEGKVRKKEVFKDVYSEFRHAPFLAGVVFDNGKIDFMDSTGKLITKPLYTKIESYDEGWIRVAKLDKWGFIDLKGKEVVPCIYNYCYEFEYGLAKVEYQDKWGVIDTSNRKIVPFVYHRLDIYENLITVSDGQYWGIYNSKGELLTDLIYDKVESVSPFGVIARKDDLFVYVTAQGKVIMETENEITDIKGLLAVKHDYNYQYFNYRGEAVTGLLPEGYPWAFSEGFATIGSYDHYFYMDTTGGNVFGTFYSDKFSSGSFFDGKAVVRKGRKYGVIDRTGKEIIPIVYPKLKRLYDSALYTVSDGDDKLALLSPDNRLLTEYVYSDIRCFDEDLLIRCVRDGKKGLLDRNGKLILPCMYDKIELLRAGLGEIVVGDKMGIVDLKDGKILTPVIYDDIVSYDERYCRVLKEGKWGMVAPDGREVVPCMYDYVTLAKPGRFIVGKDRLYGVVDEKNNIRIPIQYERIQRFYGNLIFVKTK